jgi:serine phosphatase RsbU (regulator of sigma subunit)
MIETEEKNTLQYEYDKLYKTNKELVDSIYYSESVQRGVLPNERHFDRIFSEHFVVYKPQGIVGGDLYWIGQKGKLKYFAVGDCTGHGISGAMLSVLALSFLNYIVLGKEFESLGDVLQEFDKKWIETFHQGTEYGYNNDWLEIGICCINEETGELQYAGAFNKLICISPQGNLTELLGNKYPIGGWQLEKERTYTTYRFAIEKNSMLYLYSDGFKDQFGFLTQKRFTNKRFKELLFQHYYLSMNEQKEKIEHTFNCWKGIEEQTDDVCLLGIRV